MVSVPVSLPVQGAFGVPTFFVTAPQGYGGVNSYQQAEPTMIFGQDRCTAPPSKQKSLQVRVIRIKTHLFTTMYKMKTIRTI